jgi:phosphonoacetaldehyde hydrolase
MKIKAVIFDWAGTLADFGSMAPVNAFRALFKNHNMFLTTEQIRAPMGTHKRDHIQKLLAMPDVAEQWSKAKGREVRAHDINRLYRELNTIQKQEVQKRAAWTPFAIDLLKSLKQAGVKVGTCTGYTSDMAAPLYELAKQSSIELDANVSASSVRAGRPHPWMCFELMKQMDVYPPTACLKIGDTVSDIQEGLNAGMWTIGITTGNELAMMEQDFMQYDNDEMTQAMRQAHGRLLQAGAHYTTSCLQPYTIWEIIRDIEKRMVDSASSTKIQTTYW